MEEVEIKTRIDNDLDKTVPIIEVDQFIWKVPDCCAEGWPDCPHVAKKQKPAKRNIAL